MSEIIVSVSGVRGILGDSLTPDNIIKYVSAFAEFCRRDSDNKNIVVGRDGRFYGEIISELVCNTLRMAGFNVTYIGIVPTPTVQIAVEDLKAAGGIAITASHNPQIWNGLKFLYSDGTFLDQNQIESLKKIADSENFIYADIENIGFLVNDFSFLKDHVKKVLKLKILDTKKIKKRKFKIVLDTVNSAGSFIAVDLLKKLGCKIVPLFCDGSGIFPHTPEPIPENLSALCKAVKKNKADLGVAIDPDSDRLVLITDKGEPFIEENTVTMAANFVLRKEKSNNKNVTVNLSTSRSVEDIAKFHNGKAFKSPVGEINVVKEMIANRSIIGGEGSGGIIYPELHYGRDAIVGLALILNELADFKGKLSEYKKSLPQYHIVKSKIENVENPDKILNDVIKKYTGENCVIDKRDGVKIDFENHWIHLRKSNTEPIIRIITEAKSEEEAIFIQENFINEIKSIIK
ncbi:MAG TPA: phosphoglucosamine mutase [Ignavibacteria bacterium]|nr:phosphoglucosamine mutase [Ignavibacteria bacterium]